MKKEKQFLCKKCGLEFPESEFTSISEEGHDICPACGKTNCFEEIEGEAE